MILVMSNPIPGVVPKSYTPDGKPIDVFMPKLDVQETTMKTAMTVWPNTLINGEVVTRSKVSGPNKSKVYPIPSYLVPGPHNEDQVDTGGEQLKPPTNDPPLRCDVAPGFRQPGSPAMGQP